MQKRSKTKPTGTEHKRSKVRIGKKRYGLMGAVLLVIVITAAVMIRLICDHTEMGDDCRRRQGRCTFHDSCILKR